MRKKRLMILLTTILTFGVCITVFSEDKIPLRFPLGLAPGISSDSANVVLKARNCQHATLEHTYNKNDFYLGETKIKFITLKFWHNKLYRVGLYSKDYDDRSEEQFLRLLKSFEFLEDTYVVDYDPLDLSQYKYGSDLMNNNIVTFENKLITLELFSLYFEGKWCILFSYKDKEIYQLEQNEEKQKEKKKNNESRKNL